MALSKRSFPSPSPTQDAKTVLPFTKRSKKSAEPFSNKTKAPGPKSGDFLFACGWLGFHERNSRAVEELLDPSSPTGTSIGRRLRCGLTSVAIDFEEWSECGKGRHD